MRNLFAKRIPFATTALLLMAFMFACSHDEPEQPEKPAGPEVPEWEEVVIDGDGELSSQITFHVGDGTAQGNVMRGASDTNGENYQFNVNDLVAISIDGKGTKNYKITDASTGALTYTGSVMDGFFWQSKSETVSLSAWSYGNANDPGSDPHSQTYTLPTDQSAGYEGLLYSPATDYPYATMIEIPLYHQLSRIVINLQYDQSASVKDGEVYIGDGTAAQIPVHATFQKPTDSSLTPNYGTWTLDDATETGHIKTKEETADACYSAVIIPTTYHAGDTFITIQIGSERFIYTLTDDITLEAGKQYNYTITIKNKTITFSVTISSWGNTPKTIDF